MVRSRDGVEKAFNDRNSVAAKNWENTIAKKPKQPSYSAPKIRKPSSDEIWQRVERAVANYFPDGDPSDYLNPWIERNNLNWDDVTRAIKKNGYKDLWDYWNALAHDYNSDADHDERISGGKENRPRAPFMESKTKESSIMKGIISEAGHLLSNKAGLYFKKIDPNYHTTVSDTGQIMYHVLGKTIYITKSGPDSIAVIDHNDGSPKEVATSFARLTKSVSKRKS
jgi:hypothetical protein